MFKNPEELSERLEKGNLPNAPRPITNLNRSGDSRGKSPSPHLNEGSEISRGRTPGAPNIPDNLRSTIGALARVSGIVNTAEAFGVSRTTVQDAKFGTVSGRDQSSPDLINSINAELAPIRESVIDRMKMSIEALTDEKLKLSRPMELSKIAANLSIVLKNTMVEATSRDDRNGNQVVIYAPNQKPVSDYDTIEIGKALPN